MLKNELVTRLKEIEVISDNFTLKKINTLIDNQVKHYDRTIEKNYRKIINIITKQAEEVQNFRTQKKVKEINIVMCWSRGNLQAMQTQAEATIQYQDGTYNRVITSKTGGYGYDKESTTMAELLNKHLRYLIIDKKESKKKPYGVHIKNDVYNNYFEGGVGISCYYNIIEYLGGKFENIMNTKTSNIYRITFKKELKQ